MPSSAEDTPHVVCDPQHRFGSPRVKGVSVSALVERVRAGDSVDAVAEDFGMTRGDVLVACWFVARHGEGDGMGLRTKTRHAWKTWLDEHTRLFSTGNWPAVPDPPADPSHI